MSYIDNGYDQAYRRPRGEAPFIITITGTGSSNAVVSLLPPGDWPLNNFFGRTKANAYGGPLTATAGTVTVPLSNPGMGQVVRCVVQGGTFVWYGFQELLLEPGGSATINLSFQRQSPICTTLSVNLMGPVGEVTLFQNDFIMDAPPNGTWCGIFRTGTSNVIGTMKSQKVAGSFSGSVVLTCADAAVQPVFFDQYYWNDGWQGDFCASYIEITDSGGFC